MKKYLSIVVILLMVVGIATVSSAQPFGNSRIGAVNLNSKTVFDSTTEGIGHCHVTTSPTSVYRISYSVPTAATAVALYDNSTTGKYATTADLLNAIVPVAGGSSVVKTCAMAGAADTQYTITYDPPLRFDYGVLVGFPTKKMAAGGAQVTVEYRQD